MIKVIEAISDTNIGGAGMLLLSRLEESDRTCFDTTVILPRGSKLCERLRDMGIKYKEIDGCADSSFDLGAISDLYREIKRISPHILNSHACLSARIAGRLARVPAIIQTRHSSFPVSKIYDYRPARAIVGFVSRILSDKTIAVAHVVKSDLCKMGIRGKDIAVIINGARRLHRLSLEDRIKLREKLGILKNSRIVGICARLEKCKDHQTFLRAARLILESGRDYCFLIVGEGSERKNLEGLSKKLGIADRVIFAGFCENVAEYMSIFDVNVNCSVGTETSSLALSEGMSLSLPAVASDYGGNPYMIQNGVNGFLYPQRDAVSLAKRIIELENENLYATFSKNAYERFLSELNCARMTRLTEELYKKLLKKRIDRRSLRH